MTLQDDGVPAMMRTILKTFGLPGEVSSAARLLASAVNALYALPCSTVKAVLGPLRRPKPGGELEYVLCKAPFGQRVKALWEILVPPVPVPTPCGPRYVHGGPDQPPNPLLDALFLGDTRVEPSERKEESRERWFFVNGIVTNRQLARLNRSRLEAVYDRPITLVHNPTDGIAFDLYECCLGKGLGRNSQPGSVLALHVAVALADPDVDRVVVIGHSQGTIIARHAVRQLQRRTPRRGQSVLDPRKIDLAVPLELRRCRWDLLRLSPFARRVNLKPLLNKGHPRVRRPRRFDLNRAVYRGVPLDKLEVILYANCTLETDNGTGRTTPLPASQVRNISNKGDLVARLGILAQDGWLSRWFDVRFRPDLPDNHTCTDRWGHLLNEHYLLSLSR